ncbi:MAG: hypothetical protein GQ534_05825 [Candidatus Delongbacteria bacterium]|nr:hypothetical protein [Candidatus Delongbacteria bacterium]
MKKNKQLQELEKKIAEGLTKAHKKMIIFKKYKNSPVIISKNGKVIKVKAEDISS